MHSAKCYALSLNDVHDNSDRMIVQEEYVNLQHLTGRQSTHDACCDDRGVNAHCADFSSPADSFLQCDVAGRHVWLNAPFAKLDLFI